MLKMIEVVGISDKGFSEAVKEAVEQTSASGKLVHFIEVVEQRASVREGKIKEYQVIVKVAVEIVKKKNNNDEHLCATCHTETGEKGHLCIPTHQDDEKCDWCGALIPDERHLCDDKLKELAYICNTCGRTAVSADYLCNPVKIEEKSKKK